MRSGAEITSLLQNIDWFLTRIFTSVFPTKLCPLILLFSIPLYPTTLIMNCIYIWIVYIIIWLIIILLSYVNSYFPSFQQVINVLMYFKNTTVKIFQCKISFYVRLLMLYLWWKILWSPFDIIFMMKISILIASAFFINT